jgi:serine/threonine protein kinase
VVIRLSDTQLAPGDVVGGRYTIEATLGRGGLATVYRARDESLGRPVALKVIDPSDADASAIDRARSEIELLASLSHPALVTLFDAGSLDTPVGTRSVLVMELVDGPDLGERLAKGPVAHDDVVRLTLDLAEALHVVHDRGIVHRDVKPGNVLLAPSLLPTNEFRAKLADFGIAYLVDASRLTATGTLVGTAAYLSPEQARGTPPGAPSDVYSLGLVILEALTGVRAFPGTLAESVGARLARDPEIPATLSASWRSLLATMTAREPAARPTALEVAIAARDIASVEDVPLAATAQLDYAPTRVMTAPVADETERIGAPTIAAAPRPRPRRRWPLVAALALVLIVGTGVAVSSLGRGDAPAPAAEPTLPTGESTLPAVDGDLGVHLDELYEAVTP